MSVNNCKNSQEQYLDIVAVYPIRFGELDHQVPFNVHKSTTTPSELGINSLILFLAMRKRFITYTDSLNHENPIDFFIEEKGTVKAIPQKNIVGHTYTVSLQFKTMHSTVEQSEYLVELMTTDHDLLFEASDGNFYFVRCPKHAYRFTPEETITDSYITTLNFEVNNINGIQPIVL